MKLRDNKGSITIFVLVGLLFMTSFLIISFGSNVNKSKSAKEQFNILSSIYSFNDGDENAYKRAYTAIRRKNAQQLNASVENYNTLNLTKTFVDTISDYKIYGNSIQNGTPSPTKPVEIQGVGDRTVNLFDINSGFATNSSYYLTEIEGTKVKIPYSSGNTMSAEFNQYIPVTENEQYTCSLTLIQGKARILIKLYDETKTLIDDNTISISGFTYNQYYQGFFADTSNKTMTFPSSVKYIRFCTVAMSYSEGEYTIYSNIQFEKGSTATEYEPYSYKIPVQVSGKNLWSYGDLNTTDDLNKTFDFNLTGEYIFSMEFDAESFNPEKWNASLFVFTIDGAKKYYAITDVINKDSIITDLNSKRSKIKISGNLTQIQLLNWMQLEGNIINIQLEECESSAQTTYTEYEPYVEPQIINIFLDEPLRKIGEYKDYIDFGNQKIYRNVEVIDNTGTLTIDQSYKGLTDNIGTNIELPELKTYEDYTNIEVLTSVAPSKIEATYYGYTME